MKLITIISFQLHIAAFILLVFTSVTVFAAEKSIDPKKNVSQQDTLLAFEFRQVPIKKALLDVSKKTGIKFLLDKGLEGTISAKIMNLSEEETVRRLLRNYNHAMIFSKKDEGGYKLSKVKVFRNGKQAEANYTAIEGTATQNKGGPSTDRNTMGQGQSSLQEQTIDGLADSQKGGQKGLNPFSPEYRGRLMQEIHETRQAMSTLQHKAAFENKMINQQISELQQSLTNPESNKPEIIKKIQELENIAERKKQSNTRMIMNENKNEAELQKTLAASQTPEQQKQDITSRVNRQAGTAKPARPSQRVRSARSPREMRE